MLISPELEEICQDLYWYRPQWGDIVRRFRSHPAHQPNEVFYSWNLASYFSKIFLELALEDIARKHPDIDVCFEPLTHENTLGEHDLREPMLDILNDTNLPQHVKDERASEIITDNWRIHYDLAGRLHTINLEKKPEYAEPIRYAYDKVVLVDGMPTDFEIKIAKRVKMNKLTQRGNYEKRLAPLRELFGSDLARVMVVPKYFFERVAPKKEEAKPKKKHIVRDFIQDNGVLVPFYTDPHIFREHVQSEAEKYGIKTKEPTGAKVYFGNHIKEEMQGEHSLILFRNRTKYSTRFSVYTPTIDEFGEVFKGLGSAKGSIRRGFVGVSQDIAKQVETDIKYREDGKYEKCTQLSFKRTIVSSVDHLLLAESA